MKVERLLQKIETCLEGADDLYAACLGANSRTADELGGKRLSISLPIALPPQFFSKMASEQNGTETAKPLFYAYSRRVRPSTEDSLPCLVY